MSRKTNEAREKAGSTKPDVRLLKTAFSVAAGEVRKKRRWTRWAKAHDGEVQKALREELGLKPDDPLPYTVGGRQPPSSLNRVRARLWSALSPEVQEEWKETSTSEKFADM